MKGGVRKTEDGERYTARGKGRRVIDHNTRVCDEALSARVGGEGKSLTLSRMEGIAHTCTMECAKRAELSGEEKLTLQLYTYGSFRHCKK